MGKKITFIGFFLAVLSLLPYGLYHLVNNEDELSLALGMITLVGFPLFSLVSFTGMMIWAITEIRNPKKVDKDGT